MKLIIPLRTVLFLILFTASACQEITEDKIFKFGIDKEFNINVLYSTSDGQHSFRISDIGDSRCPEGVECIWAGEVAVKGKFTAVNDQTDVELHTVLKDQEKQPKGFSIQIVDAQPYPKAGMESKPKNLTITLNIQKN